MASYPCILIRFISYGMKWSDPGILTNQDCIFHWCFFCSSTWKWLKDWKLQTLPRLFRVMVSWSLFFFNRKFDVKLAGCTAWKINIYIYIWNLNITHNWSANIIFQPSTSMTWGFQNVKCPGCFTQFVFVVEHPGFEGFIDCFASGYPRTFQGYDQIPKWNCYVKC